jgi:condensin complex subunit 1
MVTLVFSKD